MDYLLAFVLMLFCSFIMAIGVMFKGHGLKGSCGGEDDEHDKGISHCGVCPKKEKNLCPSSAQDPILDLARLSNPNR